MPIVDMKHMLNHAYDNGYAVAAFDVVSLDFVNAIVEAAEHCRSPMIISLAESHFDYFDFELLMAAVETAARRTEVPVAIHLDHGMSLESAIRSINLGCNGVMVDASHYSLDENIRITREVTRMAQDCGIPVEGELGYVPGVEGEDAERHPGELVYTSVSEAREYVTQTGVDFLAVSIGTVHGRMKGEPELNIERLKQINEALNIPLVLHGGTGLSDEQYRQLIQNGIVKINYYTALADAAGDCISHNAAQNLRGYTGLVKGVIDAIRKEAIRCIELWGSAGRADEVLENSRLCTPVEHVIVYNAAADEQQVSSMMSEGRRVLSAIPGVRRVITGEAVKQDATYRYSWVIEFCNASVIDSYRKHPDHLAFADKLFRPLAGDRISIDYQSVEQANTYVETGENRQRKSA